MDQQTKDTNKRIAEYKQMAEDNEIIIAFMQNSELILEMTRLPDWNCLMLVVEKIRDYECNTFSAIAKYNTVLTSAGSAQIKETHKAVVEFIKWYNKERK